MRVKQTKHTVNVHRFATTDKNVIQQKEIYVQKTCLRDGVWQKYFEMGSGATHFHRCREITPGAEKENNAKMVKQRHKEST